MHGFRGFLGRRLVFPGRQQEKARPRARAGELLTEQKAELAHGEWLPWVEVNCPFSDHTARNYMHLYAGRAALKSENVSSLTDAYRAIGVLAESETDLIRGEADQRIKPRPKDKQKDKPARTSRSEPALRSFAEARIPGQQFTEEVRCGVAQGPVACARAAQGQDATLPPLPPPDAALTRKGGTQRPPYRKHGPLSEPWLVACPGGAPGSKRPHPGNGHSAERGIS